MIMEDMQALLQKGTSACSPTRHPTKMRSHTGCAIDSLTTKQILNKSAPRLHGTYLGQKGSIQASQLHGDCRQLLQGFHGQGSLPVLARIVWQLSVGRFWWQVSADNEADADAPWLLCCGLCSSSLVSLGICAACWCRFERWLLTLAQQGGLMGSHAKICCF